MSHARCAAGHSSILVSLNHIEMVENTLQCSCSFASHFSLHCQLAKEVQSLCFLESCHIKKRAFYSSLGHSSILVQNSSPVVHSTNSRQLMVSVFRRLLLPSFKLCSSQPQLLWRPAMITENAWVQTASTGTLCVDKHFKEHPLSLVSM